MTITNVIEVKNVWKSFKTVQAVKGIDLNIPEGQFVAILGPFFWVNNVFNHPFTHVLESEQFSLVFTKFRNLFLRRVLFLSPSLSQPLFGLAPHVYLLGFNGISIAFYGK